MYLDGYVYPNVNYGYSPIQRVPNVEVVDAYRVPLDGRVSYFVLQDDSAIHEEAEKTRALITANTMQELRDKLAEKDRELQAAQFNVGQCAQTAMIVNQLRPFPQPAYTVANPYVTPTATA